MNNKKTLLVTIIILAALIVGAATAYNYLKDGVDSNNLSLNTQSSQPTEDNKQQNEDYEQPSSQAPDFTVTKLDGTEIKLSDFRGKPTVLNFWASWCGPCKMEMPAFEDAYITYKDDMNFLMVNMTDGSRETVESAHSFIAQSGYTFPVYYDTMIDAAITYGVSSVPRTYFIDSNGDLIGYAQSMLDRDTLQKGIDMIFSQN